MGCIGMSRDDFCRCTPSQFYTIYEAWGEMRERDEQSRWERTRMQCLCSLQPYSKKQLKAQDVMQFPWDGGESEARSRKPEASRDEILERYRKARERAGLE